MSNDNVTYLSDFDTDSSDHEEYYNIGKTEIDILETNRNAKKQAISRDTTWLPKTRQNK